MVVVARSYLSPVLVWGAGLVVNHCEGGPSFFHEPRVKTCCCLFSLVPEGLRQPQRRQPCRHMLRPQHDILRP